MTRPYSLAFKQKMVERLTGKNAVRTNRRRDNALVGITDRLVDAINTLDIILRAQRPKPVVCSAVCVDCH